MSSLARDAAALPSPPVALSKALTTIDGDTYIVVATVCAPATSPSPSPATVLHTPVARCRSASQGTAPLPSQAKRVGGGAASESSSPVLYSTAAVSPASRPLRAPFNRLLVPASGRRSEAVVAAAAATCDSSVHASAASVDEGVVKNTSPSNLGIREDVNSYRMSSGGGADSAPTVRSSAMVVAHIAEELRRARVTLEEQLATHARMSKRTPGPEGRMPSRAAVASVNSLAKPPSTSVREYLPDLIAASATAIGVTPEVSLMPSTGPLGAERSARLSCRPRGTPLLHSSHTTDGKGDASPPRESPPTSLHRQPCVQRQQKEDGYRQQPSPHALPLAAEGLYLALPSANAEATDDKSCPAVRAISPTSILIRDSVRTSPSASPVSVSPRSSTGRRISTVNLLVDEDGSPVDADVDFGDSVRVSIGAAGHSANACPTRGPQADAPDIRISAEGETADGSPPASPLPPVAVTDVTLAFVSSEKVRNGADAASRPNQATTDITTNTAFAAPPHTGAAVSALDALKAPYDSVATGAAPTVDDMTRDTAERHDASWGRRKENASRGRDDGWGPRDRNERRTNIAGACTTRARVAWNEEDDSDRHLHLSLAKCHSRDDVAANGPSRSHRDSCRRVGVGEPVEDRTGNEDDHSDGEEDATEATTGSRAQESDDPRPSSHDLSRSMISAVRRADIAVFREGADGRPVTAGDALADSFGSVSSDVNDGDDANFRHHGGRIRDLLGAMEEESVWVAVKPPGESDGFTDQRRGPTTPDHNVSATAITVSLVYARAETKDSHVTNRDGDEREDDVSACEVSDEDPPTVYHTRSGRQVRASSIEDDQEPIRYVGSHERHQKDQSEENDEEYSSVEGEGVQADGLALLVERGESCRPPTREAGALRGQMRTLAPSLDVYLRQRAQGHRKSSGNCVHCSNTLMSGRHAALRVASTVDRAVGPDSPMHAAETTLTTDPSKVEQAEEDATLGITPLVLEHAEEISFQDSYVQGSCAATPDLSGIALAVNVDSDLHSPDAVAALLAAHAAVAAETKEMRKEADEQLEESGASKREEGMLREMGPVVDGASSDLGGDGAAVAVPAAATPTPVTTPSLSLSSMSMASVDPSLNPEVVAAAIATELAAATAAAEGPFTETSQDGIAQDMDEAEGEPEGADSGVASIDTPPNSARRPTRAPPSLNPAVVVATPRHAPMSNVDDWNVTAAATAATVAGADVRALPPPISMDGAASTPMSVQPPQRPRSQSSQGRQRALAVRASYLPPPPSSAAVVTALATAVRRADRRRSDGVMGTARTAAMTTTNTAAVVTVFRPRAASASAAVSRHGATGINNTTSTCDTAGVLHSLELHAVTPPPPPHSQLTSLADSLKPTMGANRAVSQSNPAVSLGAWRRQYMCASSIPSQPTHYICGESYSINDGPVPHRRGLPVLTGSTLLAAVEQSVCICSTPRPLQRASTSSPSGNGNDGRNVRNGGAHSRLRVAPRPPMLPAAARRASAPPSRLPAGYHELRLRGQLRRLGLTGTVASATHHES